MTAPLTEQEETERGAMLAAVLHLRRSLAEHGRYVTDWGTKTPLGLFRTIKRIVEESK